MQTTEALAAQPVALAKVPAPPLLCPSHQPGATAAPFPASGSLCVSPRERGLAGRQGAPAHASPVFASHPLAALPGPTPRPGTPSPALATASPSSDSRWQAADEARPCHGLDQEGFVWPHGPAPGLRRDRCRPLRPGDALSRAHILPSPHTRATTRPAAEATTRLAARAGRTTPTSRTGSTVTASCSRLATARVPVLAGCTCRL